METAALLTILLAQVWPGGMACSMAGTNHYGGTPGLAATPLAQWPAGSPI